MTAEGLGQKAKIEPDDGIRWGHYPIKIIAGGPMLAATML
jgi:hypothetical protein